MVNWSFNMCSSAHAKWDRCWRWSALVSNHVPDQSHLNCQEDAGCCPVTHVCQDWASSWQRQEVHALLIFLYPKDGMMQKDLCFVHIVSLVSGDLQLHILSSCWDDQEKKSRRRRSLCDSGWSGYWGHWVGECRKLRGPRWCLSEWVTASDGRLMRPSNLQFSCRVGICLLLVFWCYQTFSDSMKSAFAHNYLWHSLYNASACTYSDANVDKGKGAPALLPAVTLLVRKHTEGKCTSKTSTYLS